jgi:hypothetical protein
VQQTSPSVALKFFRENVHSANVVAMHSNLGYKSWNFFKQSLYNHIPLDQDPFTQHVLNVFSTVTKYAVQVGLSDWARYGADGVEVEAPVFPYRLSFEPPAKVQQLFPDTFSRPFPEDLKTLPRGTKLYAVHALDRPKELGGTKRHIADLVLVSDVVSSKFGDTQLLFRHQDMAEDLALRPKWKEFASEVAGAPSPGCPANP